jgi:hypothetical protein
VAPGWVGGWVDVCTRARARPCMHACMHASCVGLWVWVWVSKCAGMLACWRDGVLACWCAGVCVRARVCITVCVSARACVRVCVRACVCSQASQSLDWLDHRSNSLLKLTQWSGRGYLSMHLSLSISLSPGLRLEGRKRISADEEPAGDLPQAASA